MPLVQTSPFALWSLLALLVPIGLTLLAVGAAQEERAEEVATTALLALASAAIGYWLCGFALQFGGVAFVSGLPGLQSLTAEWSPLDVAWGPGWGLLGLRGFLLSAESYNPDVYSLFFSHLSAVTTAVLVTQLALCRHVRRILLLAIGLLVSGLIYPLFGNWVWGGGWLANLGLNQNLGHGFVDAGGAGAIFLLGLFVALGVLTIVRPHRPADEGLPHLPPIHFPLFMILGAMLAYIGWAGLVLGNPLIQDYITPAVVLLNLLLAAAGGALVVSIYSWFVTTQPNALAVGRGMVAGLVAVTAACPFIPSWAALLSGAVGGLLFLLGLYLWEQRLRLNDPSGMVAVLGAPAIWGVVAVALFSDGRWGAGWNGVGAQNYLGVNGQGITGLIVASGHMPARVASPQLYAQLTGLGALFIIAWLTPWLMAKFALWLRIQSRRAAAASAYPVPAPLSPEESCTELSPAAVACDQDASTVEPEREPVAIACGETVVNPKEPVSSEELPPRASEPSETPPKPTRKPRARKSPL